jgi:hypothetical protein
MKLHIKRQYYKHIRKGEEPIKFHAVQPKGIGTDVYATIKLDPILRKKKLRIIKDEMLGHEMEEIKNWGHGKTNAHTIAKSKEPKTLKKVHGVNDFWKKADRMLKNDKR